MQAFSLSGNVSVDTRPAIVDLRTLQVELKRAREGLRQLTNGRGAKIKLKLDTDGVKEAAKEAARAVEVAAKRAGDASERQAQRSQRAVEKAGREELRQKKEWAASWARELEATERRNGTTIDRFGTRIKTLSGQLKDISGDVRIGFRVERGESVESIRRKIIDIRRQSGAMPVDLQTDEAKREINDLAKRLRGLKDDARVNVTVDESGAIKKASTTATGDGGKGAGAARTEIADRIAEAATASGLGIGAGLGLALKATVDFDRALRNVNSVAQLSEPNLQKLSKSIAQVSADPRIRENVTGLTTALYDIYSVGYKGAKALDILRQSALGAAAGNTTTAISADVLTTVLSSGIKGVKNARQALDVLFQTANDGKTNFPELASSIGAILPTAAKAGISLQELGAAIALATRNGQSTSEATNDLLNVVSKLVAPSAEAAKAMDALGIKYGYSELAATGLSGKLKEIQDKTKGQGDAIKQVLPDLQAQRGVMNALTDNGKKYIEFLDNSKKASEGAGAAGAALAKQNQGAGYQADITQKTLSNLSVTVGTQLVPALDKATKSIQDGVQLFTSLDQATQSNVIRFAALSAIVLLSVGPVINLIKFYGILKEAQLLTAIAGSKDFRLLRAVGTGTFTALRTVSMASFAAIRAASATAFGAVGISLAAVVAIVWGFRTAFIGAQDAGTMSADRLIEKWGALGRVWVNAGDDLGNLITKLNGVDAANANADASWAKIRAARATSKATGQPIPKSDVWKRARGLPVDGSHAKGLDRVPFDGYRAILHKNERVLNAEEAKSYNRESSGVVATGGSSSIGSMGDTKLPAYMQRMFAKVGERTAVECGQAISDALRSPGFATKVARGEAGRTVRPVNGRLPDGAVVSQSYGRAAQHFFVAYTDAQGTQRKLESTTAGGSRRYRSDRPITSRDLARITRAALPSGAPAAALKYAGGSSAISTPEEVRSGIAQGAAAGVRVVKSIVDAADAAIKAAKAALKERSDAVANTILDLDKADRMRGRDNPVAQLNEQQRAGDFKGVAKGTVNELYDKTRRNMREDAASGIRAGNIELRERAGLLTLENKLIKDGTLSDQQMSEALQIEAERRARINELVKGGWTPRIARAMADHEAAQKKLNLATTASNDLLRQQRDEILQNAADLGDAVIAMKTATQERKSDEYFAVFNTLTELMADAEIGADRLREALSQLPIAADMKGVNGMVSELQKRAALNDNGKWRGAIVEQSQSVFDDSRRSLDEYSDSKLDPVALAKKRRDETINALNTRQMQAGPDADMEALNREMSDTAALWDRIVANAEKLRDIQSSDASQARVTGFLKETADRMALLRVAPGIERDLLAMKQNLAGQGWSDEEIQRVLPSVRIEQQAQQMSGVIDEAMGGFRDNVNSTIEAVKAKGLSGVTTLADGIVATFDQMLTRIISNAAWGKVEGWLGNLLGGLMGGDKASPITGIAGPVGGLLGGEASISSRLASDRKGLFDGVLDGGHERIPFDGYTAILHKDEAVLTAQQAHRWREMDRLTAHSSAAAAPAGGSTGHSSGGGTIVENHYHGPITVKANNTREFERELPRQQLPRREQKRRLALAGSGTL